MFFFFSSRRRHTRCSRDWSSDVCSSDLATLRALAAAFSGRSDWVRTGSVPFSSARKWSAASFAGHGSWILGAPEVVLELREPDVLVQATVFADTGLRVLVLAQSDTALEGEHLPTNLQAVA